MSEEMVVLERVAQELFGCRYSDLNYEDQDFVYCYVQENM